MKDPLPFLFLCLVISLRRTTIIIIIPRFDLRACLDSDMRISFSTPLTLRVFARRNRGNTPNQARPSRKKGRRRDEVYDPIASQSDPAVVLGFDVGVIHENADATPTGLADLGNVLALRASRGVRGCGCV